MTGYGRGDAERDGCRAAVEVRSVNHRFADVKLRGASLDAATEDKVMSAVRAVCRRGAVTVTIRAERRQRAGTVRIDREAARRAYAELSALAEELGMSGAVPLELICAHPGVLSGEDSEAAAEAMGACVVAAAEEACARLAAMRKTEGAALESDLRGRLATLTELVGGIAGRAAAVPEEALRRLRERIERLLAQVSLPVALDDARLIQEAAYIADRSDITEELVRLRSHLDQFGQVMAVADEPIGRRLDFLVQEIGREINTISSKSQAAEIARAVIHAKAELEKVREQIQNIE